MKNITLSRGFTLVELLVVISVISMLSSVIIARVDSVRAKSRDAVREQQIRQIDLATQMYIQEKGHAPYLGSSTDSELCKAQTGNLDLAAASACFAVSTAGVDPAKDAWNRFKAEISDYMPNMPDDPCPTCDSDFGYLGYTYVAPLALQYQACSGANPSPECSDPEYFNQNYGLYTPLEDSNDTSGNVDDDDADSMSGVFGSGGAGNSGSDNDLTIVFSGMTIDAAYVRINNSTECSATSGSCVFDYPDGSKIDLELFPEGYENYFTGWVSSVCSGTSYTCSFYLNRDRTVTLDFGEQVSLDTVAPVISNISARPYRSLIYGTNNPASWTDKVEITWNTNELSTTGVDVNGFVSGFEDFVTEHSQIINRVNIGTVYNYNALSTDQQGNATVSGTNTFRLLNVAYSASGPGKITVSEGTCVNMISCSVVNLVSDVITITAIPDVGATLSYWTNVDCDSSTENTCTFTLKPMYQPQAVFVTNP